MIRAALEIHRTLGPGLETSAYHRALEIELDGRGFRTERGRAADLVYKGHRVGRSRVPLWADGIIIAIRVAHELTLGDVSLAKMQAKSLRATAILLNFGAERLELRRARPPQEQQLRPSNPVASQPPSPP